MRLTPPKFTIERLRTLVLVGGVALVLAIIAFLAAGQWKLHQLANDLPGRLGVTIKQQANGIDYTQSRKGKILFKIHAARAVQLKLNNRMELHDVRIELYGEDGNKNDTISGAQFEYDPSAGMAEAAGAVEITLMRPAVKPAIAQLKPQPSQGKQAAPDPSKTADDGEIHVKTSGLIFDQKKGIATTSQRVDFSLRQGSGSSTGATYDSGNSQLTLDHTVELHILHSAGVASGGPMTVRAAHAELDRTGQQCRLNNVEAQYRGTDTRIANALLHFRDDGSVLRLDGSGGVSTQTETGGRLDSSQATFNFDEDNHPQTGTLSGSTSLEMTLPERTINGTAPIARLTFSPSGELRSAHLESGVSFESRQQSHPSAGPAVQLLRTWKSQVADIVFRSVPRTSTDRPAPGGLSSRIEPKTIHGQGGVIITARTLPDDFPSQLNADTVTGEFGAAGALALLTGEGNADFEQTSQKGVKQSSRSDRLEARFLAPVPHARPVGKISRPPGAASFGGSEIESIVQIGHVLLTERSPQQPTPRPVAQPNPHQQKPDATALAFHNLRANSDRAEYNGKTNWLRLTGSPRIEDDSLSLSSDQVDLSRLTGDATASGSVRASYRPTSTKSSSDASQSFLSPGGQTPLHVIAGYAEIHQEQQQVIFRDRAVEVAGIAPAAGSPPSVRLWQGGNSVSAPAITLNQRKQTLDAEARSAASPVQTVLLTPARPVAQTTPGKSEAAHESQSLIRITSGTLHYSESQSRAAFEAGSLDHITTETTTRGQRAIILAHQAEVFLQKSPAPANHSPAAPDIASPARSASGSIDRLIATGQVDISTPGRRGTGEKLVYLGSTESFTLTGSPSQPPRIQDQVRGTITGSTLIFHTRDDSVEIEGAGSKTVTETRTPKKGDRARRDSAKRNSP